MEQPIGVFDSGVGGLSIAEAIFARLPNESVVFFGDTARVPYGNKSPETLRRFALDDAAFLMSKGVKAIVVACNTIASLGLEELEQRFHVPIIGVIEPSARAAVAATRNKRIGLIGTRALVASRAYRAAIGEIDAEVRVHAAACPLFVPLIEEGWTNNIVADIVIDENMRPFEGRDIDTLVLGCSHYALMRVALQRHCGPDVTLIDNAGPTAEELERRLGAAGQLRSDGPEPQHEFYVSDLSSNFSQIAQVFLGERVEAVQQVSLEEVREWMKVRNGPHWVVADS
ncbi:MAG: glutamate racemase [Armatimonadota bacterium]